MKSSSRNFIRKDWEPNGEHLGHSAVIRQNLGPASTPATFEGSKGFPRDDHLDL